MILQKKEFLENLKACMPGIETGSTSIQGADAFIFHNGKIFSYNDNIAVSVPTNLEEIEGAIKAEEFFKTISKFPSDEIKFSETENGTWLLKCGKAKAEMNLLDFDFESRVNSILPDKKNWVDLKEDFIQGIGTCKMSINKTQVAGIFFSGKDVVSTDGNQMNHYIMEDSELPTFWVSDSSANELMKLKKLVALQLQGSWVHFKAEDGTIFSVKTLQAEKFPFEKIKNIIDTSDPEKAILHAKFPKDLFAAIDRAVSFSIDISEHNAVRLTLSKEKIEVSSERNSGKYSEKVAWSEEIKEDFEKVIVYVDASMMEFVGQRTVEFYMLKGPVRNGKVLPRLLFVTDSSKHLLSTLDNSSQEE